MFARHLREHGGVRDGRPRLALCGAKHRSWKGSHELEERRSAGRREILAIGRDHLSDARLYADRRHMIDSVGPEKSCNFYLSALRISNRVRNSLTLTGKEIIHFVTEFR